MSFMFDDEQVVPDLELRASDDSSISSQSSSLSSDSDSLSSQVNSDNSLPASKVTRQGCRATKYIGTNCLEKISLTDTRAAVSAMQRLAARIIRKANRKGYGKHFANKAVRRLMKKDLERRNRFISELREGNREIAAQMRQAEAEFGRLFETMVMSFVGPTSFSSNNAEQHAKFCILCAENIEDTDMETAD